MIVNAVSLKLKRQARGDLRGGAGPIGDRPAAGDRPSQRLWPDRLRKGRNNPGTVATDARSRISRTPSHFGCRSAAQSAARVCMHPIARSSPRTGGGDGCNRRQGGDPGYYLRCSTYYLGGQEPKGIWLSQPDTFGIAPGTEVEPTLFEWLHAGLGPDGRVLVRQPPGRRVGNFDVTLSAPNSVSIVYALADADHRARIEAVQRQAAEAVAALLNREACFIRRGRGVRIVLSAKRSIAAFQHAEARPARHMDGRSFADMALHTHLCIANLGEAQLTDAQDQTLTVHGAIDGRAIYALKMACCAVYHASLAAGLQRLGYAITPTGRNGTFEIAGRDGPAIHEPIKAYFSARRRQVEERLAEYPLASAAAPALAAAVNRATRSNKLTSDSDRFRYWRERAAEQGLGPDFLPGLRFASTQSLNVQEHVVRSRIDVLPDVLTQNQFVLERRHLVAAVAAALVGTGAGPERVETEISRLSTGDRLSVLGHDRYGHALFSTPELVAIEHALVGHGRYLAARP
ncbi:MobF family relaxase [Methylorubrum aminovorans]|uniref:MobF family relaxase n=1 Tax=Methylorubrum aminovorans TaxID=269069 RepID=UPI0032AFA81E